MTDKERIIKQLDTDISRADRTGEMIVYVGRKTALGVIALLKEQEAVEPIYVGDDSYECGFCGTVIGWDELNCSGIDSVRHNFCPNCGKKVTWNG